MAHKKGVGSTDNGRDSNPKFLGVKMFGGEAARAGNIIVRQRGTKYHPGENVYMGKDFTLHARVDGTVTFRRRRNNRVYVNIVPDGQVMEAVAPPPKREKQATPKPAAPKPAAPKAEAPKAQPKPEAPKAEPKPAAEPMAAAPKAEASARSGKVTLPSGRKIEWDDLKVVEGIGPKIEGLLHAAGIKTWRQLADAPTDKVQGILDEAGPRYRMHQPVTWAKQADMADQEQWNELEKYQDYLDGGRDPKLAAKQEEE